MILTGLLPTRDRLVWETKAVETLSLRQKVQHYVGNVFRLGLGVLALPIEAAKSLWGRVFPVTPVAPNGNQSLPAHCGFADSLFQTSGLGTKHSATKLNGQCNWSNSMDPKYIEGPAEYKKFFTDVLSNPDPFIQQLQSMGVTAYRFSLEWAVLQTREGMGTGVHRDAFDKYQTFIEKLKKAGIEPYVTLHHFTHPQWFQDAGGFDNLQNVETFIAYAKNMMATVSGVKYWMTFNEPGVFAFQGYIRGCFPPHVQGDIAAAGRVMRNMLYAHCRIYSEVKPTSRGVQIGITHQWLKFEPFSGNPTESAVCYFLSQIAHYAVYNFFKTGQFSLQVPFKANVQFSVPKEKHGYTDFIGVQFYGFPRLKIGWNGGQEYPGYKTTNLCWRNLGLTFGSTCPPGGKMQSFGPSFYPESMQACLDEAFALGRPVAITETGCDARIQKWGDKEWRLDDDTQAEYFQKIFPILMKQKQQLHSLFVWTFWRGHLEWDRGDFPRLGVVAVIHDAKTRAPERFVISPAGKVVKDAFVANKASAVDQKASA